MTKIILKVGYETSSNLVELIETYKNLEEEFEGTFEQDELVNIKNFEKKSLHFHFCHNSA